MAVYYDPGEIAVLCKARLGAWPSFTTTYNQHIQPTQTAATTIITIIMIIIIIIMISAIPQI